MTHVGHKPTRCTALLKEDGEVMRSHEEVSDSTYSDSTVQTDTERMSDICGTENPNSTSVSRIPCGIKYCGLLTMPS